jgi:aryl-alcohol dehydrogenase-like predicted oxidoreductase
MAVPTTDSNFLHDAEMGLGAWAWGDKRVWDYPHGYTDEDIAQAFRVSMDAGVRLIDTAEVYGSGRSEQLIGRFVRENGAQPVLATKFMPYPWRLRRADLEHALHASLERLGLERVDLYQIHFPVPIRSVEYWVEGLADLRRKGLTRAVGVSNFGLHQTQRAYSVLAKYDIPLASNQVCYHLLDRRIEKNGLLERCQELGIRLIAYSPLAMGLLTGKYTASNPPPPGRRGGQLIEAIQPLIKLMVEIGQDQGGKSPAQIALNWCICKGTLPIPGAKNLEQAETNAGALGWRLTEEQLDALDEAADGVPQIQRPFGALEN